MSSAPPTLWHEPAPRHFDLAIPWWVKLMVLAAATVLAIFILDQPLARWARAHPIPDLYYAPKATAPSTTATAPAGPVPARGDAGRELMFLEQYGQFTCSVVVILAVALVDPKGRRRALALAIACLTTLLLTHLIKDLAGRARPFVASADIWRGPFQTSSAWGSFPSAHTTAAFALAAGLSWFYPRGRALFVGLALITAAQRILHTAHYLSDVLAGIALGVTAARFTLQSKVAGRLIALAPPGVQAWWQPITP